MGRRGRAAAMTGGMAIVEALVANGVDVVFGLPGAQLTSVEQTKSIWKLEETRPGILAVWGNDGNVSQQDLLSCIRLLGQEVFPQARGWAKELGLNSPFEAEAPVSIAYARDVKRPKAAAE